MIEHVLDNLAPISGIERVFIVSNAKFASHFEAMVRDLPISWGPARPYRHQRRFDRRLQ